MRGTPCYMAPELFSEGATHSTLSDLWAVGCVLYECSMGRPPFMNSSFNQLVHEILNNEPQPIPGNLHACMARGRLRTAQGCAFGGTGIGMQDEDTSGRRT